MAIVRVVVLVHGGQYVNTWHKSKEDAAAFIEAWAAGAEKNLGKNPFEMETKLIRSYWSGGLESAVCAPFILGMYIPREEPSAADRAATAIEKMAKQSTEGDEWKEN